jgi:hypothetical protein
MIEDGLGINLLPVPPLSPQLHGLGHGGPGRSSSKRGQLAAQDGDRPPLELSGVPGDLLGMVAPQSSGKLFNITLQVLRQLAKIRGVSGRLPT